jgi:hypothetical protein
MNSSRVIKTSSKALARSASRAFVLTWEEVPLSAKITRISFHFLRNGAALQRIVKSKHRQRALTIVTSSISYLDRGLAPHFFSKISYFQNVCLRPVA